MSKERFKFRDLFEGLERNPEYLAELAIVEFTENMAKRMAELGITRSELARRLDTSPAYITKILQGNANFTLKSMVKISQALESRLTTHMQPEGAQARWFDLFQQRREVSGKPAESASVRQELAGFHPVHVPAETEDESDDSFPLAS